jgi:hypothetical protein
MKQVLLTSLVCIALLACTTDDKKKSSSPEPMITGSAMPGALCYVLCDFSGSLDDDGRQDIITNAIQIFKAAAKQSRVKYFDMAAAQYAKAFFEYTSPARTIMKPSERANARQQINTLADSLSHSLQQLAHKPSSGTTCIIRAIDNTARSLQRDLPDSSRLVRIIILSDMLENCSNAAGRINLQRQPYSGAMNTIAKMKQPAFDFARYPKIEIDVIASSGKAAINTDALQEFWKKLFQLYGYRFTSPITPTLPAWIIASR